MIIQSFQKSDSTQETGQAKILIAEDSAVTQDILKMLLEARGHVVTVAHDGSQALKMLVNDSFDIVFLDFHMPRLNGVNVVREFRRQAVKGRPPLFVAMTADLEGLNANKDSAAVFSRVLAKPFEFNDVFDLVSGCLKHQADSTPELLNRNTVETTPGSAAEIISIFGSKEPDRTTTGVPAVAHEIAPAKPGGLPDIRYLSWPADFGPGGFAPAVSRQLISGRKYDAVLITEPCDVSELEMLWNTGELCLLPVLDQTGTLGAKADLNLRGRGSAGVGNEALIQCVDDFSVVRSRIHSDLLRSKTAAEKLLARIYLQDQKLQPVHHGDSLLGLTHAVALSDSRVIELAEDLTRRGLLERSFFDRFHVCPACESSRLNVREECIRCRSADLEDSELIHHFSCAHQAPEEAFRQGSELVCPKCRHELRHFGIEYDKPGNVITCRSCSSASSDAAVGFKCLDCLTHMDGEAMPSRDRFAYRMTQKGVTYVEEGQMAIGVQPNLRFANLPLPLVVDINRAARAFNEDGVSFALVSIAYPLRHKLTAENGARAFHIARNQFLHNLKDGFGPQSQLHAGADVDYLVLFDTAPPDVDATLAKRVEQAQSDLKRPVMPDAAVFGPSDLTGQDR